MSIGLLPKTTSVINWCRITHHMCFWSDLVSGWGGQISSSISQNLLSAWNSRWKWLIECPSKANIIIWSSFLCNSPYTSSYQLLFPLGSWLHPTHWTDFIPLDPIQQMAYLTSYGSYWHAFQMESHQLYCITHLFGFPTSQLLFLPITI